MIPRAFLDNISIILVDTIQPGNIGSASRALKNMGLRRLKLVNPPDYLNEESRMMAVSASDLLETADVFTSFDEAIAEEQIVIGTTSTRGRKQRTHLHTVKELAPRIARYASSQKVGIAFGPERRGLKEEQLAQCQYLVSIPTAPALPTLNLSQAVMVLAYELFNAQEPEDGLQEELVSLSEREQLFEHMERTLISIGFLSESNPGHIMRSIRRFLGKADLIDRDVRILRGIMTQMDWYVRQGHKLEPGRVKKP